VLFTLHDSKRLFMHRLSQISSSNLPSTDSVLSIPCEFDAVYAAVLHQNQPLTVCLEKCRLA
jgi:hypothetical protein